MAFVGEIRALNSVQGLKGVVPSPECTNEGCRGQKESIQLLSERERKAQTDSVRQRTLATDYSGSVFHCIVDFSHYCRKVRT